MFAGMFMYRSLALGLLGACCLLLAMRPPIAVVEHAPGQIVVVSSHGQRGCVPPASTVAERAPTILDVAPGLSASQVAQLIRLSPGEHIATIDDVPVTGSLDAGVALASIDLRSRRFVDLGVTSEAGSRRVLVLLH